jgi:hypothetical protein
MRSPILFSIRSHVIPPSRNESLTLRATTERLNLTTSITPPIVPPRRGKWGRGQMQLELIRLALLERPQKDIEDQFLPGAPPPRENWLRTVFGHEIPFIHRREQFHYVPDEDMPPDIGVIAGRIGRKTLVPDHLPPESGLKDTLRESWPAARILIDPRHHQDGQKVGVQHEHVLGMPFALFSSLVAQINSRPWETPYEIEASPIVDADTFWTFVDKYKGQVTSVLFEFVAPNMFGEKDNYDKEMRDMKAKEKIHRAKLEIESPDGLELHTDRVKRAVDYISPGQGTIKATTKNKQTYKSARKIRRITVEKKAIENATTEELIRTLVKRIFTP